MVRIAMRLSVCLLACGLLASAKAQQARPAADIVKEIEAIGPRISSLAQAQKKIALIGELYKAYPDDAHLLKMLPDRWSLLSMTGKPEEAMKEADAVLATTKDETLKTSAMYTKAQGTMAKNRSKPEVAMAAVETFASHAPKDPRVATLLYQVSMGEKDEAKKTAIEDRILKDFPDSPVVKPIAGLRKQKSAIGKPFELEFTDAIKDTAISMKNLKGKVVVIDFWATWCGPCIAEMPNMKKLYAEYKNKGVEFIGVSLDQKKEMGGLDKLKEYVAKNDIQWLQYYQGDYWQSEFSSNWGINSIPCVFIVDTDGNLFSVEARGKLETMIPELLKKAKAAPAAGGL